MDGTRSWSRASLAALAFVCVVFSGSSALAQSGSDTQSDGESDAEKYAVAGVTFGTVALVSSTVGLTTTTVGGIALVLFLVNEEDSESKEAYIRRNAVALKRDLSVGGGATVEDLAVAFRIESDEVDAFGRMLRERRSELLPLTDIERLNRARADRFFQIIARGMRRHPELRDDWREIAIHL